MKTLSVVCPVYNEEDVIAAFHGELSRVLRDLRDRWQTTIVYVVDRSTDTTTEKLREIASCDPAVRLVLLSARFGQQAALLAGLDHCDSDAVVMMDSDLQHPPAVIPALLAAAEKGIDVVYTVREESPDIPWAKRATARAFYRLMNAISPTPIHQGAADFRLISRRVLRVFQRGITERGVFLRGLFNWVGFSSTAVRFEAGRRRGGRSKYSLRRMLEFASCGVTSFSRLPLRAAGACGAGLLLVALAGGLALLLAFAAGRLSPSPWHGLALLSLLLCAIQLIFLGVFGEYLGRVLDEVQGRPRYLVDETVNFPAERHEARPGPPPASA